MPTVSRRSTSLSCQRSRSRFSIVLSSYATDDGFGCRFGVISNPTAEWISRQITEAFPWDYAPEYLIRDRDRSYGSVFVRRLCAMGIRDRPIAPRSPWQNAYVERLIGTIRRECLDHMIVFGETHLRRIVGAYAAYYNESRTHRSLDKDAPFHRAIQRRGAITSQPVLGGLHHQYCRI
jgi:transposase InsO family protein